MKNCINFLLFILTCGVFAQNELKSSDVAKFAYEFEIVNNDFVGKDVSILENRISESQFFLLGEQHFSPEISEFTNALLPKLKKNGFNYFALEVGPNSTQKMCSLIEKENSLYNFNSEFYAKYKDIPFPFFDGKKDEMFLKTALNESFEIWGIDQEFITAHLFLIDELYELSDDKKAVRKKYKKAKQFVDEILKDEGNGMHESLLNSKELEAFFAKCNSEKQKEIIEDLKISWNIYRFNDQRKYVENNRTRMQYMKLKFGENYKKAAKKEENPKVVIKMGSMHLMKGKNWLGNYDLGNTFNEIASMNGTKSTSINCFARFEETENGEIYDYLDEKEAKYVKPLLELAKKDKWILIETKPILELVAKKKIKLEEDLEILLNGFDFVLFSPIRTQVKMNFKE
ncbi:hypothetical protein [Aureivirga sp. CE67]|uniref:hypothetical protein n=1 Tax=Aureivirga sp. CE67 TaxID=1788983 RepID=UPI0018CB7816|nr:hypothetical protein [Aureivirga sp. CE67]